jgi:hypothetical protein
MELCGMRLEIAQDNTRRLARLDAGRYAKQELGLVEHISSEHLLVKSIHVEQTAPFKFRLTVSMPPLVGVRW